MTENGSEAAMYERIMFTLHFAGFRRVLGAIVALGAQLQW
ncbi:hypothetical protein BN2475_280003 [Paraburkholderia ribeironis]|uniref:Uncharacterized protein n=1 Tax=Paraburkholderia ribeironis TaxID=1247936 RepID=A0A1N7S103_9BURK|nr:hypothetical protein BN2475_280003 [Paraburkholderia ribeironis]